MTAPNASPLRQLRDADANPLRVLDGLRGEQVSAAEADLWDDAGDPPRYPYPRLDALLGALAPGRVTVIAAGTGQGKTTLSLDLVDRLADAPSERRVYVLGLEQAPKELRTKWACLRAGVPAWVAFERAWGQFTNGAAMRERVAAEFRAQRSHAIGDRVIFDPTTHVDRRELAWAAEQASAACCEVLVVDHIDRIKHGPGTNPFAELAETTRLCTDLADQHELHLLVFSQLNRESGRGDRLAKYYAPQLHHLFGGSVKEQEADVVLALHRPLKFDITRDELAAARAGTVPVRQVLEPGTACVSCLKHRLRGADAEGQWTHLRVEHGRLSDLAERDRYATTVRA